MSSGLSGKAQSAHRSHVSGHSQQHAGVGAEGRRRGYERTVVQPVRQVLLDGAEVHRPPDDLGVARDHVRRPELHHRLEEVLSVGVAHHLLQGPLLRQQHGVHLELLLDLADGDAVLCDVRVEAEGHVARPLLLAHSGDRACAQQHPAWFNPYPGARAEWRVVVVGGSGAAANLRAAS